MLHAKIHSSEKHIKVLVQQHRVKLKAQTRHIFGTLQHSLGTVLEHLRHSLVTTWPSIKPGTWNIPEHSGTSNNYLMIIMRKICKIKFSKTKYTEINCYQLEIRKYFFWGGDGLGESVEEGYGAQPFLQLTTLHASAGYFPSVVGVGGGE